MNRTLCNLLRSLVVLTLISLILVLPSDAREYKIAVAGLVHPHVWGHLKEMLDGHAAKLVGVAESDAELVAEAKKHGVPESLIFADYATMIQRTKPDIVWSFVETSRHLEIARYCAPRKIHVMFEKPLAASFADAVAIERLARKNGIQVMVNYQMAWWPSNYAAKAVADSGALGQVWRVRGIVGLAGPSPKGIGKHPFQSFSEGALTDFQCYTALWSLWYLGKPEKVYAQVNHLRPETFSKLEDNSTMILWYQNGVALSEGGWDLPRALQDLEVFGRDGSVTVTRQGVQVQKGRTGKPQEVPLPTLPPERAEPIVYMVHMLESGKPLDGLVALPINVDVVEITEAARMSAASGQAVCLPLPRPPADDNGN